MKLPQLSLRELFLLVALAAMGCGWWVERGRLRSQIWELQNQLIDELSKDITGESSVLWRTLGKP